MMNSHYEYVFLARSPEKADSEEWTSLKIEWAVGLPYKLVVKLGFAPARCVNEFEIERQVFVNPLQRLAVHDGERRPHRRMAINERLKRALEYAGVKASLYARRDADMVSRAVRR
jgi:hypothetical protein